MTRILLLFSILFCHTLSYAQGGAPPVQSCSAAIPEICNGALYPAATSGTATAPFGANLNCGFISVASNASFYYFVSSTTGPLSIYVTPTDVIGVPYPNVNGSPDLDYKCWGPFDDLTTMCDQLTNANSEDCSTLDATNQEIMQIINAEAGKIYVVMVSNWADVGNTPDDCFIQFTSVSPSDGFGGPSPGDAGGSVGLTTPLFFCDTDPPINLIDELNGSPVPFGYWTYNSDTVTGTFNPAETDSTGTYTYTIPGTANCPSDEAYVVVDVFNASSISITSPSVVCSNENTFTLTGIPPAGFSPQGQGVFTNTNTGMQINSFNIDSAGVGTHNITYTYTPIGCVPIPVTNSITVNEAPTVLASNVTITNPSCFGYDDGTAVIVATNGTPAYTPNWYGQDPLQLTSGTFNYTITDANGCVYESAVTLYDPLNTSSIINEYNSSCFGANNGSASITMLGAETPPGTISDPDPDNNGIPYCGSNPSPNFFGQAATIISEVQLNGDNFNLLNNTQGANDLYEDYTNNTGLPGEYADMTEGQIYTVYVKLDDMFTPTGNYAPEAVNVYIDFNIDGDFDDAGEDLGVINIPYGSWIQGSVYSFNFLVPSTGAFGATRMRVVCMSNQGSSAINMGPCESATGWNTPWFGATEDYSVVLNSPASSANFLWTSGSTSDSISNLPPGTYYVIITVSGCPIQDSAIITEPEEITFNPIISDITCNSFADGAVILNPSGGNGGGYTINWGGIDSSALGDGTYNITVTDPTTITANNLVACENDTTIVMTEPEYFSVDFTTSEADGEICLNDFVTLDFNFNQGGIIPFTVNYTLNATAQTAIPILTAGNTAIPISPSVGNNTYIITSVTDSNGCVNQNTIDAQSIYVHPLPDVSIQVTPNTICDGDSAILFFNVLNGQPDMNVYYNANGTIETQPITISGLGIDTVWPNTTTTYQLDSVGDLNQCFNTLTSNTTLTVNEIPQMDWSVPSEICDNDIVYLSFDFLTGTPPWNVIYNINGTEYNLPATYNISDSVSILPLNGSSYSVVSLTDGNTCKNPIDESLTIVSYPLPEIVLSGGGSICDNGSTTDVIFTITSGTPPYDLEYSAGLTSYSRADIGNIYVHETNEAGIYSIQELIDEKGCKASSISGNAYVNVNPLPEANISAYPQPADIINPQINFIDLSNGHISGVWHFDDGDSIITNFEKVTHTYNDTGLYAVSLTVESDSGCISTTSINIMISPVFTIYVPNAFTPNNDLYNDYFLPIVNGVSEYELGIYDRSGKQIFRTNNYANDYLSCINDNNCSAAWNGKVNNEYATKGAYIYAITLTDLHGKIRTYEGTVMLIR